MVVVRFALRCETQLGDRIFVVGNHQDLGRWRKEASLVELTTCRATYPVWSGQWKLQPCNTGRLVEFKFVVRKFSQGSQGLAHWEDFIGNRKLLVQSAWTQEEYHAEFDREKPSFRLSTILDELNVTLTPRAPWAPWAPQAFVTPSASRAPAPQTPQRVSTAKDAEDFMKVFGDFSEGWCSTAWPSPQTQGGASSAFPSPQSQDGASFARPSSKPRGGSAAPARGQSGPVATCLDHEELADYEKDYFPDMYARHRDCVQVSKLDLHMDQPSEPSEPRAPQSPKANAAKADDGASEDSKSTASPAPEEQGGVSSADSSLAPSQPEVVWTRPRSSPPTNGWNCCSALPTARRNCSLTRDLIVTAPLRQTSLECEGDAMRGRRRSVTRRQR
mmetsp:Transcript_88301/g.227693  ORF Transcript_88301/g.227693 Transcript_88301/m.227693 type:complete len:388 (-) Transcript_88301:125-1288(-)